MKVRPTALANIPTLKSHPTLPPIDPHQRYTPEEAAAYLRSSRCSVFRDIREKRLASFTDGKRRYITGVALIERSRAPDAAPERVMR